MANLNIYGKAVSLIGESIDYATARTTLATGEDYSWFPFEGDVWAADSLVVGQEKSDDTYAIYRAALYFDTRSVNPAFPISSVSLALGRVPGNPTPARSFNIQVAPLSWMGLSDAQAAFEAISGITPVASYESSMQSGVIVEVTLPLDILNAGGYTQLVLASSLDLTSSAPSGEEVVDLYPTPTYGEAASPYAPTLIISYNRKTVTRLAPTGLPSSISLTYTDSKDRLF